MLFLIIWVQMALDGYPSLPRSPTLSARPAPDARPRTSLGETRGSTEIVALLAEQLAHELARTLAPLIEQLVEGLAPAGASTDGTEATQREEPQGSGLWTVRDVASHYNVTPTFVYQHADELGCLRLGGGTRARLRFDPQTVRERWPQAGGALPRHAPQRPSRRQRPRRRTDVPLLEFERDP
jgi:hypothetical protein